jgi:hypothetical protein
MHKLAADELRALSRRFREVGRRKAAAASRQSDARVALRLAQAAEAQKRGRPPR